LNSDIFLIGSRMIISAG